MINSIFGRINNSGNVEVFFSECGESVTRLDESIATIYPVDSDFSAAYEHPNGIVISKEDASKIGLSIEGEQLKSYAAHSGELIIVDTAALPKYNRSGKVGYYTCEDNEAVYVLEYSKYLGCNKMRHLPQVAIPAAFRDELERMAVIATAEFESEYELKMRSLNGAEKFDEPAAFSDDVRNTVKALQEAAQYKDIETAARTMTNIINEFSEKYSSGDFIYKGLI